MIAKTIKDIAKSEFAVKNGDFYWILLKSLIVSAFIVLGLVSHIFMYVALLLGLAFITIESGIKKFYYLIFLLPFNHVFALAPNGLSFNSLLLLYAVVLVGIKYLINIFKKKEKIDWIFFGLMAALAIYSVLPIKGFNLVKSLAVASTILFVYFCYVYRKDLSFKEIVFLLIFSTVVASITAVMRNLLPLLDSYLQKFYIADGLVRFTGLIFDPNYYALEIITLLCCLTALYYSNKIRYLFYPLSAVLIMFGIMATSKAFILVLILWLFVTFVMLIAKRNKKVLPKLISLVLLPIVLIASMAIVGDYTKYNLSRFDIEYTSIQNPFADKNNNNNAQQSGGNTSTENSAPSDENTSTEGGGNTSSGTETPKDENSNQDAGSSNSGTDKPSVDVNNGEQKETTEEMLSNLTTGRTTIWKVYLKDFKADKLHFVIGHGVGAEYLEINGQPTTIHNTIIQIVYCYGLIGTLLICGLILYCLVKTIKKKNFSIFNWLLSAIITIMMCSLDCVVGYRFGITILIIGLMLNLSTENDSQIENIEEGSSKKKKLLLVHRNLTMGGVERSLINFVKNTKEEYDITIMLMSKEGKILQELPKDVKVIELNNKMKFYGFESVNNSRNVVSKMYFFALKVIRKLFSFIPFVVSSIVAEQEIYGKYDCAISFYNDPFLMEMVAKKVVANKKFVICHVDANKLKACEMPKSRMKHFDKVLGVSLGHSQSVAKKLQYLSTKIDYLYNFQNIDEMINKSTDEVDYEYYEDKINFIVVARVAKMKGSLRLATCVKKLVDEGYDNFVVRWVGYGQEFDKLKVFINENNIQDKFVLLGNKNNPYPYIKKSDMFVLASIFGEACPMVYAEAMSLGVPLLSTENASANEIIKEYGIVCDNSDEALYATVKHIVENKDKIKVYKEKLKEYKFDTEGIKNKLKTLIGE